MKTNESGKSLPLVSVVMAVYNGSRYLEDQIWSLLNQSYANMEVIIVDDCSTDGSAQIAERIAMFDSRVKFYRNQKNIGLIKNFLGALRHTRGKLVCFSDQDDVWQKDKIEILSSLILKDSRNMLAYSDLEICDAELRTTFPSFWKTSRICPRNGMLRELALLRNIMPGCSVMFRTEIKKRLLQVPLECSFMHDHLAFIFAASLGRIVFTRKRLVKYRQHGGNSIGAFHSSVADKVRFHEQLRKEIRLLSHLLPMDLRRMEIFLERDAGSNSFGRISFIHYYWFLRPDTFTGKFLGIFECLLPDLYRLVQRGCRANRTM